MNPHHAGEYVVAFNDGTVFYSFHESFQQDFDQIAREWCGDAVEYKPHAQLLTDEDYPCILEPPPPSEVKDDQVKTKTSSRKSHRAYKVYDNSTMWVDSETQRQSDPDTGAYMDEQPYEEPSFGDMDEPEQQPYYAPYVSGFVESFPWEPPFEDKDDPGPKPSYVPYNHLVISNDDELYQEPDTEERF